MRYIIPATVIASVMIAGSASAQTVTTGAGGVGYSTTPNTSTVTPGASGASFGSIQFTGGQNAAQVTSIPVTVTPGGGATLGNLSNCQVYGPTGSSLTTGSNIVSNLGSGANTFRLDQPLTVSQGAGTTTLNVRCDVASNTPSTGTFSIAAGAPMLSSALSVNLDVAPSVPAGTQDVTLANISLDATRSGAGIRLSSIPITITAGNGATIANLTDCRVRDTSNLNGFLNSVVPMMTSGGTSSFTLTNPFTVMGGFASMLAITCDVGSATPVGGTFTISVAPNGFPAVDATTGATITPVATVGTGANGLPASTSGTVIVSAPASGGTGGTGTPGIPNTGAGGQALQLLLALIASGAVAVAGATYLRYQMR